MKIVDGEIIYEKWEIDKQKRLELMAKRAKYKEVIRDFNEGDLTTQVHGFLNKNIETEVKTIEINDPIIGKYDEVSVLKNRYRVTIVKL